MLLRRYFEYPGRKGPGFLTLVLLCAGALLLIEILERIQLRHTTRISTRNLKFEQTERDRHPNEIEKLGLARSERTIPEWLKETSEGISTTSPSELSLQKISSPKKPRLITMAIVLCSGNSENDTDELSGLERQIKQAKVSLKSAVYFSKDPIKLIVISNTKKIFSMIEDFVLAWPQEQRRKISLEFGASFYPEKYKMMEQVFRPCSTQRLFLEQVLPNEDAILYIDTDVIFMRSPGDAWDLFEKFSEKQMIAGAGPSFVYMQREDPDMKKFFEFEGEGFNAGVLLFNLTRIRNSPQIWEFQILVSTKLVYFEEIADQDILNFICNQYPEYCFKMPCEWNFRWPFCFNFTNRCPNILENGPSLVHGIGGAFFNPKHPKMVRMHEEFDRWDMSEPVSKLIDTLQAALPNKTARTGHCSKVPGIDEALLKQLIISGTKV